MPYCQGKPCNNYDPSQDRFSWYALVQYEKSEHSGLYRFEQPKQGDQWCAQATQAPEPEMVHLEPTPARVVLEMVDRLHLQLEDVFYDLGSGLGQVAILVHLLSGIRTIGVEVEPAYYEVACDRAWVLGLSDVCFVNEDARTADYMRGSVFYLFTPFKGQMLQAVLDRLHQEARARPIRVCSYGPCTPHVAQQPWLRSVGPGADHEFKLAVFARA